MTPTLPRTLSALATAVAICAASGVAAAATWSSAGFAVPPRNGHIAERLADGRVLVAGGAWDDDAGNYASAILFDPKNGTWSNTGSLYEGRGVACSARLADGRVLVAGGAKRSLTGTLGTAETYSPATGTWTSVGAMKYPRFWAACVTLPDGRVLAAGGAPTPETDSADAELFDPGTNTWSTAASLPMLTHNPRAALLPSGRVVVVAGGSISEYDPYANTWRAPVALPSPVRVAIAVLADGNVLIVGDGTPSAVLYDPAKGTATPTTPTNEKPRGAARLVTLPDGRVLAIGGINAAGKPLASAEIYDPKAKTWTTIDPLADASALHTATLLADGRVLVVGAGATASMPAQLFNAVDGTTCDRGEHCLSGYCTDGVCCSAPCGGPCQACDVKDRRGQCELISGPPRPGHSTCAPYLTCDAGRCTSKCTSDAECSKGNVCHVEVGRCGPDKNLCGPNDSVIDRKTGATTSCTPYTCSLLGTCLSACASSLDCAAGFACNAPTCVPVGGAEAEESGGCATTAGRSDGIAALLLVSALAFVRRRRALPTLALFAALMFACGCDSGPRPEPPTGELSAPLEWSAAGSMKYAVRVFHSATALADGRILVAGGSGAAVLASVELFDPSKEKWVDASPMKRARAAHGATRLNDGRVLVTGGRDASGKQLASAELYDPAADTWTEVAMYGAREGHVSVLLADGRVLVAGGSRGVGAPLSTAELFDPKTDTWSETGALSAKRVLAAAHLLTDGRVLVAGGEGGATSSELFDPATGTFGAGPALTGNAQGASLVRTGPSQLVLLAGRSKNVQLLDEKTMTFRAGAASALVRMDGIGVPLGGRVTVIGGSEPATSTAHDTYTTYDPATDAWSPPRRMTVPRFAHTATLFGTGRILVVGGLGTFTDGLPLIGPPEILNLGNGAACGKDPECTSGFCVDGRCCDRWCAGACEACDLPGSEGVCTLVTGAPHPAREGVGPRRPSCSPFGACVEGACVASCASDAYCDAAHVCDVATQTCVEPVATCDGASTITAKTSGESKSCAPYRCLPNGSCLTKCSTSDDCSAGTVCDGNRCFAPAASTDGGCATSPASAGKPFVFACFAAMLGAWWLRRRGRA